MKKCLWLLALLGRPVWGYTPYVSPSDTLSDGASEIVLESSLFQTLNRVTPDAVFNSLQEGEKYQSIDAGFRGSYGLTNQFQGNLGFNFRTNLSSHFIENDLETVQTAGAQSAWLGFRYSWPRIEQLQYAIEGEYRGRLYTNKLYSVGENITELALGDDGPSTQFGIAMSYYTKSQNFFSGQLLFRNPGTVLSSEILLRGEYAMLWQKFSLLAGVESVTSMNQDAYGDDPENKPLIANGATAMFNSVNRSWLAGHIGMGMTLGSLWRLELKASNIANGVSTDLGTRYTITLARRTSNDKVFKQKNQAFKEYTIDGVVTKISNKGSGVVIDKGIAAGIEKNMKIDFYYFDYLEGNELIASGFVIKTTASKSIVKITRRFSKRPVKEGTVIRAGLIRD